MTVLFQYKEHDRDLSDDALPVFTDYGCFVSTSHINKGVKLVAHRCNTGRGHYWWLISYVVSRHGGNKQVVLHHGKGPLSLFIARLRFLLLFPIGLSPVNVGGGSSIREEHAQVYLSNSVPRKK